MRKSAFGIILILLALCGCISDARARPHGGSATVSSTCPNGNSYADGCAAAPTNALFQNSTFFTDNSGGPNAARQSSQTYITRPPWNVAGVDYPIGQTSADGALIDASVSPPTGCTYNSSLVYVQCAGTGNTVDISGYKFIGIGLWMTGTGQTLVGSNWHQQMTAQNCRRFNGIGPFRAGSATINISSGTGDFNSECANNADQYGTAGDPGFVTQSTGTATLSGYTLTFSGTPTGTFNAFQYINCTGCVLPTYVASGSGLNWVLATPIRANTATLASVSGGVLTTGTPTGTMTTGDNLVGCGIAAADGVMLGSQIDATHWNVSNPATSATCTGINTIALYVQYNLVGVTVTSGPTETNSGAFSAGHGGCASYTYLALPGWGTAFGETGGCNVTAKYNYNISPGRRAHAGTNDGQHNQFLAWLPAPGTTTTGIQSIQDFNTILVTSYADPGTYTGVMSQFSTCGSCSPVANGNPGYEIGFSLVSFSNNTLISNYAKIAPAQQNVTSGMIRTLSQGPSPALGSVNWSLASGVVTINSVVSGSSPAVSNTILCTSFPNCTQAVKLISQIDATHFNTINTTDTKTSIVNNVASWPGEFTTFTTNTNYFDLTSANGPFFLDTPSIAVTTRNSTGNINMPNGASVN